MDPKALLAQYNAKLHLPASFEQAALHSPEGWAEFIIKYLHENADLSQEKLDRYLSYVEENSPDKKAQKKSLWRAFRYGGMHKAAWVNWESSLEEEEESYNISDIPCHWFLIDYVNKFFSDYRPSTALALDKYALMWDKHQGSLLDYLQKSANKILVQELIPVLEDWKKQEWFQFEFAIVILTCAYDWQEEHADLFFIFKKIIELTKKKPEFIHSFQNILPSLISNRPELALGDLESITSKGEEIGPLLCSYLALIENRLKDKIIYDVILKNYRFFSGFELATMQSLINLDFIIKKYITKISSNDLWKKYSPNMARALKTLHQNQAITAENVEILLEFEYPQLVDYAARLQVLFLNNTDLTFLKALEKLSHYSYDRDSRLPVENWLASLEQLKDNNISVKDSELVDLSEQDFIFFPFKARTLIFEAKNLPEGKSKYQSTLNTFLEEEELSENPSPNLYYRIDVIIKLIDIFSANESFNPERLNILLYLIYNPTVISLYKEIIQSKIFATWTTDPTKAEFIQILLKSLLDLTQEDSFIDLLSLLESLFLHAAQAFHFQNQRAQVIYAGLILANLERFKEFNQESIQYLFINLLIICIVKWKVLGPAIPEVPLSFPEVKKYFIPHPKLSAEIVQSIHSLLHWLDSINFLSPIIKTRLFHARRVLVTPNFNYVSFEQMMRQHNPHFRLPPLLDARQAVVQAYLDILNPFVFLPQAENILYILKFLHKHNLLDNRRYDALLNLNPSTVVYYSKLKLFLENLSPDFQADADLVDIWISHSSKLSKELAEGFNNLLLNNIFSKKIRSRLLQLIVDSNQDNIQKVSQDILLTISQMEQSDNDNLPNFTEQQNLDLLSDYKKLKDLLSDILTENDVKEYISDPAIFEHSTALYQIVFKLHSLVNIDDLFLDLTDTKCLPYTEKLAEFLGLVQRSTPPLGHRSASPYMIKKFPLIVKAISESRALRNALALGLELKDIFFYYINIQHTILPLTYLFKNENVIHNHYIIHLAEEIFKQFSHDYSDASYFIALFYKTMLNTDPALLLSTSNYLSDLFKIFLKYDFPIDSISLENIKYFLLNYTLKTPLLSLFEELPKKEKNIESLTSLLSNDHHSNQALSLSKSANYLNSVRPFTFRTIEFLRNFKENIWKVEYFLRQLPRLPKEKLIYLCQQHREIALAILNFVRPNFPSQTKITSKDLARKLRKHFPFKEDKSSKNLFSKQQLKEMFVNPSGQLDDIEKKFHSILYGNFLEERIDMGYYDHSFFMMLKTYWLKEFKFLEQELTDTYNSVDKVNSYPDPEAIRAINQKYLRLFQAYQFIRAVSLTPLRDSYFIYTRGLIAFLERENLNSLALEMYKTYAIDADNLSLNEERSAFLTKILWEPKDKKLLSDLEAIKLFLCLYVQEKREEAKSFHLSNALFYFIREYHSKEIYTNYQNDPILRENLLNTFIAKVNNIESEQMHNRSRCVMPNSPITRLIDFETSIESFSQFLPEDLRLKVDSKSVNFPLSAYSESYLTNNFFWTCIDKLINEMKADEENPLEINKLIKKEFSYACGFRPIDTTIQTHLATSPPTKRQINLKNLILSLIDCALTPSTEPRAENQAVKSAGSLAPYQSIFTDQNLNQLRANIPFISSLQQNESPDLHDLRVDQRRKVSLSARRGTWQPKQEVCFFGLGKRKRSGSSRSSANQGEASCSSPPAKRKKTDKEVEAQGCSSTSSSKGKGPMKGY